MVLYVPCAGLLFLRDVFPMGAIGRHVAFLGFSSIPRRQHERADTHRLGRGHAHALPRGVDGQRLGVRDEAVRREEHDDVDGALEVEDEVGEDRRAEGDVVAAEGDEARDGDREEKYGVGYGIPIDQVSVRIIQRSG